MRKLALAFLICPILLQKISACTIFIGSNANTTLVGNNEDYTPWIRTYLWVRPVAQNYNGYVFWGFEEKYPEGGMNDKGLFYDAAALPQPIKYTRDPNRKDLQGYIVEKVLQQCSSVEDVIKWVSQYNLTWYQKVQVMVADKTGDYAIISAGYIIHPKDKKFVLTNYNLNDTSKKDFKCWRRNTAYGLLNKNPLSVNLFSKILDKVSQRETDNGTVYSQVCDLRKGIVYLTQRHDFSITKKLVLAEILQKGRQDIEIKNLFPASIATELKDMYDKNGISTTIEFYQKSRKLNSNNYVFAEHDLENLGYQLLDSNKLQDAIQLFTLNLQYYPKDGDAIAALANANLKAGNKQTADSLYKRLAILSHNNYYLSLFAKRDSVTFRIKGMEGAEKIAVAGSFNNYDNKANLFTKHGYEWVCTIKIRPGQYTYKFSIDDNYWIQDPANQMHAKPKEWWDSYLIVQ